MQMQTNAIICASTIGIDNNPVGGTAGNPIDAGARENNKTISDLDLI